MKNRLVRPLGHKRGPSLEIEQNEVSNKEEDSEIKGLLVLNGGDCSDIDFIERNKEKVGFNSKNPGGAVRDCC